MADVDVFETRFAAAYRRYLDEAETTVDAAAVARLVAGGAGRRRAGIAGWPVRRVPSAVWLPVLVAVLGVALTGAWLLGQRAIAPAAPVPSESASPMMSTPLGLTGTWSEHSRWQAVLALHSCRAGEVCGRLELSIDKGARCVYTLEHRPPDSHTYVYWTVGVNELGGSVDDRLHCDYDFGRTELRVEPQSFGSVLVSLNRWLRPSWTLSPISNQYEPLP